MRLPAKRGVAFTLSYRLGALNLPRAGGGAFNLPTVAFTLSGNPFFQQCGSAYFAAMTRAISTTLFE